MSTRYAIRTGIRSMNLPTIRQGSIDQDLPSKSGIYRRFGSMQAYREAFLGDLKIYDELSSELKDAGISPKVTKIFCGRFEPTPEFRDWLVSGKDVLAKLSEHKEKAAYALGLIGQGFNLLEEDIFEMQLKDFVKQLRSIGIKTTDELRFVFEAVPRLHPDEAFEMMR